MMPTVETDIVCPSTPLDGFLKAAQDKVNERYAPYGPKQFAVLSAEEGPKYARIVIADSCGGRSAFCFVEKATGNVLKSAGWGTPEKRNPRSNIHNADFGASGITGYGAAYLR
jgi:hypothetical protein